MLTGGSRGEEGGKTKNALGRREGREETFINFFFSESVGGC